MEPNHLEEDELHYELFLRSMPPQVTRSRMDVFRERLIMEMRGEVPVPKHCPNRDLLDEVKKGIVKLITLEKLLVSCAETKCDKTISVLRSRLIHLGERLNRISSDDNRIYDKVKGLVAKVNCYLETLLGVSEGKLELKQWLSDQNFTYTEPLEDSPIHIVQQQGSESDGECAGAMGIDRIFRSPRTVQTPASAGLENRKSLGAVPKQPTITAIERNTSRTDFESHKTAVNNYERPKSRTGGMDGLARLLGSASLEETDSDASVSLFGGGRSKKGFKPRNFANHQPVLPRYEKPIGAAKQLTYRKVVQDNQHNESRVHYSQNQRHNERLNFPNYSCSVPNCERPVENRNIPETPIRNVRNRNPIPSWNLVFTGDGKGLNLNQFLVQVNLMARADKVSKMELLDSAIHLFRGPAREWYIAFESLFHEWEELIDSLRVCFVPDDSDFMLMKEVELRQQGNNEPFMLYLSAMINLFNQLKEDLSEEKKISLIMRNMSPYLADRMALVKIVDLPHLAYVCKKIEDVKSRARSFRQVQPDQNLSSSRRYANEIELNANSSPVRNKEIKFIEPIRCWNCRELGHQFEECDQPKKRIFCYICGELGQLASYCDVCRRSSGNYQTRPTSPNGRGGYRK